MTSELRTRQPVPGLKQALRFPAEPKHFTGYPQYPKATLPMMDLDKQDCWAIMNKNFVETTKMCTRPPSLLSDQLLLFLKITAVAVILLAPES